MSMEGLSPSVHRREAAEQKNTSMANLGSLWKASEARYKEQLRELTEEKMRLVGANSQLERDLAEERGRVSELREQNRHLLGRCDELEMQRTALERQIDVLSDAVSDALSQKEQQAAAIAAEVEAASLAHAVDSNGVSSSAAEALLAPTIDWSRFMAVELAEVTAEEAHARAMLTLSAVDVCAGLRATCATEAHALDAAALRAAHRSRVIGLNFKRIAIALHNRKLQESLMMERMRSNESISIPTDEVDRLDAELTEMETQRNEAIATAEAQQAVLKENAATIVELKEVVATTKAQAEEASQEAAHAQRAHATALAKAREEQQQLADEVAIITSQLASAEKQSAETKEALQFTRKHLREAEDARDVLEQQLATERAAKATAERQLERERAVGTSSVEEKDATIAQLHDDLDRTSQKAKETATALKGSMGEVEQLREALNAAEERRVSATAEAARLAKALNEDKARAAEEVHQLGDEVEALREQLVAAKEASAKAQRAAAADKDAMVAALEELQARHDELAKREKELKAEKDRLRNDFNALSDASIAQQEELELLQNEDRKVRRELQRVATELQTTREERDGLLGAVEAKDAELGDTSRHLKERHNSLQRLVEELQGQCKALEDARDEALNGAEHTKKALAASEERRRASDATAEALREDVVAANQREKELINTTQRLKRDHAAAAEAMLAQHEAEAEALKEANRKQAKEVSTLRADVQSLKAEVSDLTYELQTKGEASTERQRHQNDDVHNLRTQLDDAQLEVRELEAELDRARETHRKAARELATLKAERATLADKAEALGDEVEAGRKERQQLESNHRKAQLQSTTETQRLLGALGEAETRIREVERQAAADKARHASEVRQLKEQQEAVGDEVLTEKAQVAELQKRLRVAEAELKDTRDALDESTTHNERLTAANERALGASVADRDAMNSALQATRVELEQEVDKYMRMLQEKEVGYQSLKTLAEGMQRDIDDLTHEREEATIAAEEATAQAQRLEESLKKSEDERQQLQSFTDNLQYELIALKQQTEGAEGTARALNYVVSDARILLESAEADSRAIIEGLYEASLPIAADVTQQQRRIVSVNQHARQMRQRLEALARDRQEHEDEASGRLQQVAEENSALQEQCEHNAVAIAALEEAIGSAQLMEEYMAGRAAIAEASSIELWAMLDYFPRTQSSAETRARTLLSMLNITGADGYSPLAHIKHLTQSLRAAQQEVSLLKHMYRTEKTLESRGLQRSMGRLAMRMADTVGGNVAAAADGQGVGAVRLALNTVEADEEASRRNLASAYLQCLTSMQTALISALDPLNLV